MSAPATDAAVSDTPVARPFGVSHVAAMTADLGRYRAFYEDVIGLRTLAVLRMTEPPLLRHAFLAVDDSTVMHVFEQPGYDPVAAGIGTDIGRRGRLDHVGFFVADVEALTAVRDRLVAAGASDGVVTPLGPVLSVHFRDPDGFEGEINAVNLDFDPARVDHSVIEEQPDPDWFDRLVAACAAVRETTATESRGVER
jgi:catechol 2,3-dioxygenase-like lactoylglutathione lyase family enzyme